MAKTAIHATAAEEPRFVAEDETDPVPIRTQAPLTALLNRTLIAAVIIGFGLQLTFGIYDVVWPLFLMDLGASIEWVGFTFMLIGIPSMILAPIIGRYVDRFGPIPKLVLFWNGRLTRLPIGFCDALARSPDSSATAPAAIKPHHRFTVKLGCNICGLISRRQLNRIISITRAVNPVCHQPAYSIGLHIIRRLQPQLRDLLAIPKPRGLPLVLL